MSEDSASIDLESIALANQAVEQENKTKAVEPTPTKTPTTPPKATPTTPKATPTTTPTAARPASKVGSFSDHKILFPFFSNFSQ
jgi:hypothetical protein